MTAAHKYVNEDIQDKGEVESKKTHTHLHTHSEDSEL